FHAGDCTETQTFEDVIRPGKKKVALVKLVSGQGAMYDTRFLANEPSGFEGGHSVIDITGFPVMLSPNEYRDGAIRAMY
ncbi:MAG: proline reductase cluster protein PrdD, partial [Lachnospiraceae bacterium]|nr:proline reductase cluster protein PrdD [Lachnospiraceae bacterium]